MEMLFIMEKSLNHFYNGKKKEKKRKIRNKMSLKIVPVNQKKLMKIGKTL